MSGRVSSVAAKTPAPAFSPMRSTRLQRKCACGGAAGPSGECAPCARKRRASMPAAKALQTKLTINTPGDRFEQEANRMADFVVRGAGQPHSISNVSLGAIQRDEKPAAPKPNNYEDAAKKIADALAETAVAKELKEKAAEMGKDFLGSVEGKVIAGTALGGALAAIIATNSELPMQLPELPLDFIAPGLKAKLVWEGPVQKPTTVSLTLTSKSGVSVGGSYSSTPATGDKPAEQKAGLTLTIPLGGAAEKKPAGPTASEKYRAETARMAAEQAKFRAGLKTDAERAEDKAYLDAYMRSNLTDPSNPLGLPSLKKKEKPLLMRSTDSGAGAGFAPPIVHDALAQTGQPLDPSTRAFMEERFGHDFGRVRVHTDAKAAASARAVNAHAYTVGEQIAFDSARFAPQTAEGRRLIAHELTHVVQQTTGESTGVQRDDKTPDPAAERIDVAIVFGDEETAMVEARSYAPTAIRVTSGADAKKKLEALGKPIGRVYVVSHSTRSGEVQVITASGLITWVKLVDLSADLKGLPPERVPNEVDFRGCKLGEAPDQVEKFRQNVGAKTAKAMNCWSMVKTVTPLTIGGVDLTSPSQIPKGQEAAVYAALKTQINGLQSDDGKSVKNCIAGLKAGETADGSFEKIKKLYWEHKGNLAAVWASPEYNHNWQEGSRCVKDLTDKTTPCKVVTASEPAPAAGGEKKKGAFLEQPSSDMRYAGDLMSEQEGESVAV